MHRLRNSWLSIERSVRQWRWLLFVKKARRIRSQWLQQHQELKTPAIPPRRCLLDLRKISCDGEQGRRFHTLVSLLVRGGYRVSLVPRLGFLQTGDRFHKANALKIVQPWTEQDADSEFDLCLTDRIDTHSSARRTIQIITDKNRPLAGDDLAVPYGVYPQIWDLREDERFSEYRQQFRPWRLFFGGHCSQTSYRRIKKYTRISPVDRYSTIQFLLSHFENKTLSIESDPELERELTRQNAGFVMIDNAVYRPDAKRWLGILASAKFFIAAPGCDYPMSHNAIESMAVGTIPVLEYNMLFTPPLVDQVNCIAYQGRAGLRDAAKRIESMSETEIQQMRSNVIEYYESHLSPAAFCSSLDNRHVKRLHLFSYLAPTAKAA